MKTTFPVLYHKGKAGHLFSWEVWADGDTVFSQAGRVDGKKILSQSVATPKNIGRSNETTAEEQAILEAKAAHKFKLDRKYSLTKEQAKEEELFVPMLAQDYFKRIKKDVVYPISMQPKLDGMRCLAYRDEEGNVQLISRSGKPWNLPHIVEELEGVLGQSDVLDGELYLHQEETFQTISSWIKKQQPETKRIQYHVYDVPMLGNNPFLTWQYRLENLRKFFSNTSFNKIHIVDAQEATNHDEVLEYQIKVVGDGYEGAIARNYKGMYNFGYRSYDLLKVKSFDDAEFKIVGYGHGEGIATDHVKWLCVNKTGKGGVNGNGTFYVVPKGTHEFRARMLREAPQHVGKLLTVKYFGLTDDGIPRFPVGKGIRLPEDMS